ncbi:rab GTPase-activating protein 1-like isoform X1 [Girardinichthys multiradiatus]|uniref:rab GTPase-activating protein 1-like isoform X1 n=2 Tax=Girardinichthys multiradiatus TaxID=208333 RepID=UPI001FAD96FE|nr:rab GTPase-activating protein 1-like isoform X1 [Girardinichthys multiradiatus]
MTPRLLHLALVTVIHNLNPLTGLLCGQQIHAAAHQRCSKNIISSPVPTKKVKLGASRLQIMDDDPLDEYLKENRRLQQASLRLEQENDSLAHRLITSKVALRNALDKAEDRVEELTKDLLQAHHQLQATEEEKRSKEEEAAMQKEVFQRELERAEQEIKKYSGVILDYKQICSQLTLRLERQEAAHREELEALKSTIEACSQCRHISESITAGHSSETAMSMEGLEVTEQGRQGFNERPPRVDRIRENQEKESLKAQITELEKELAQTKLQVVETKCKIQELEHQNGVLANDLQETKNNWISKALTSLRTTTGGHHSIGMHREGPATLNWNLHTSSLSGWTPKKLSWPHKEHSKNV